jgi:hypothetical protein
MNCTRPATTSSTRATSPKFLRTLRYALLLQADTMARFSTGLAICAAIAWTACSAQGHDDIYQDVNSYYSAEQAGRWSETFEYRPRDFRQITSRAHYVEVMNEDNNGWRLIEWQVREMEVAHEAARVRIRFHEVAPEGHELQLGSQSVEFDIWTRWVLEDDRWRCVECGKRGRLSLN